MQHLYYFTLGYGRAHDPQTYRFRFSKLKGPMELNKPYLEEFMKFPLSFEFVHKIIIGISSLAHLNEILELERKIVPLDKLELTRIIKVWNSVNNYGWKSLR